MARRRSPLRTATMVSAVLHIAIIGAILAAASAAGKLPKMQVYRVDIVSPPPQTQSEPNPTPAEPAAAEPEAAEPDPVPEPAAEPEPPPPEPAPPKPEPTPKPAAPKPTPKTAAPKAPKPAEPKPPAEKTAQKTSARAQPPSAGQDPDPESPGGEGLNVRTAGESCPSQAYCNNIARQVKRYFRRPSEARSDRGEVCFTLAADGSVDDIRVERLRGSAVFKLALIEAVEQAGLRKEFGRIPADFGADTLHPCVEIVPGS